MVFLFPCLQIQTKIFVSLSQIQTERYTLILVSTSLDISREAWLILNTALDTWRVSAHLLG